VADYSEFAAAWRKQINKRGREMFTEGPLASPSINTIMTDPRPITALVTGTSGKTWWVRDNGVTKIVPYQEGDALGNALWFAVYKGDEVFDRVNSRHVWYCGYGPLYFWEEINEELAGSEIRGRGN